MIHIDLFLWPRSLDYIAFLVICLLILYRVACIRFQVMTNALWAARRRRLEEQYHRGQSFLSPRVTADEPE
jgi:hypothetical protein